MDMRGKFSPIPVIAAVCMTAALAGCLDEPEIDERWTLLEMLQTTPGPAAILPASQAVEVAVQGRITYRAIRTGFLVAEARYANNLDRSGLVLDPEEHTLESALEIETILANSVTTGRAVKAVTGFDHLQQTIDLSFTAQVPAELTGGNPDSTGFRGLYLVLYMAEGEEIELDGGVDSLVVTPFRVEETQVLHTGHPLNIDMGGGPQ